MPRRFFRFISDSCLEEQREMGCFVFRFFFVASSLAKGCDKELFRAINRCLARTCDPDKLLLLSFVLPLLCSCSAVSYRSLIFFFPRIGCFPLILGSGSDLLKEARK